MYEDGPVTKGQCLGMPVVLEPGRLQSVAGLLPITIIVMSLSQEH